MLKFLVRLAEQAHFHPRGIIVKNHADSIASLAQIGDQTRNSHFTAGLTVIAFALCVLGSRFIKGSKVYDYPKIKLLMNRIVNTMIRYAFRIETNDITNAFKMYRREVIEGCSPLISPHFNLTVELPIKAIIRGYTWKVVPVSWKNRTKGVAKLKLREMGSRYFFIIAYLWLEKYFSRGDYRKK